MSASLLEKIDWVARGCRNHMEEPFGGVQVVFVGDFKQLPPVCKEESEDFCFDSPVWKELNFVYAMLKRNYRQIDPVLVKGLDAMRNGILLDDFLSVVSQPKIRDGPIRPTQLVSTNQAADQINSRELEALETEKMTYKALEKEFERGALQSVQGEKELKLAIGAQVMCVVNKSPLVNGSRGVVTGFREKDAHPIVLFYNLKEPIVVEPHLFEYKIRNQVVAYRKCVPLKLAWAITIHKSQSLTIDLLDVDCNRIFAASQAYVAVSRARSVEGLYVKNLCASKVWTDPRVEEFYRRMENASTIQDVAD
jgi:ATP-dependent DNA helicase PIF1